MSLSTFILFVFTQAETDLAHFLELIKKSQIVMRKIILITVLIMIAMPFFVKAKNYISEKLHVAKVIGTTVGKAVKQLEHEK